MDESRQSLLARAETSINLLRSDNEARRRQSSNNSFLKRDSSRQSVVKDEQASYFETPKRQKLEDSIGKTLNSSDPDFVPPSPWEWRRVKGETIALKAQITQQEATIDQLHKARYEIEEVYRKEKKLLEIQAEADKATIKQLEKRIDVGRRTIQDAKSAQAQAEQNLIQMRSKMEQKVLGLVKDNNKLTEEIRQLVKQNNKPEGSYKLPAEYQVSQLTDKLEVTNKRIAELEEKLKEARKVQENFEIQCVELQSLKAKYDSLETEKSLWEEGKKCMERAAKATEYEKKLEYAEKIIESLREGIKGKLLLEEQIATMQNRLKRVDDLEKEIARLEYVQGELKAIVADYESIGISGGPSALKREFTRLQQTEMLMTAEEGQLKSKIEALQRNLESTQQEHEETKKILNDTKNSYERVTRFMGRLQKKTLLVSRERDSYRQQLDSYEKEITGYQSGENPSSLLSERIPALERTVEGYRELVAKLEADLDAVDGKNLKEESKKLRDEIDRLKGELEHRALKGDFNIDSKIIHFKMNPATIAYEQAEQKQKALLEEVEKLRAIVATGKYSEAPVSSLQAQEIAELQQKHEIKISRLKEAFKASSHEYRQACYQLFGWRVDRTKEGQYKLSSQYAESPDDYLFFLVNEDGVNMVETPFSATLSVFIERHLNGQHSVPMFLNAIQSDLFDQQTVITNSLMM